jgi:hypothetical protein
MINYSPGIHAFTPMREDTQAALWKLWRSHPEMPYLSIPCIQNSMLGSGIQAGVPDIIFAQPIDAEYKSMTLEEAAEKLDKDALSRALFAALSDRWITEFADDFQRQTTAIDFTYGCAITHALPGCLFLQNVDPAVYIEDRVEDDWDDNFCDLWNLGVFAAGPTQTAHEQIAAIAAVEAVRPAWSMHIDTINQAAPSKVRMSDPAIHPGREGYCDP